MVQIFHIYEEMGIVGYLTSHEAYCLWVGYHIQVIIYTHEDEVI